MTTDAIDLFVTGIQRVVREGHRIASIEAETMDDARVMVTAEDEAGTVLHAVIMAPLADGTVEDLQMGMTLLAAIASAEPLQVRRATV